MATIFSALFIIGGSQNINKLQYFGLDEGDKGKYVIEFCSFAVLCVWLFTTMIYAIVLQEIRFRHM